MNKIKFSSSTILLSLGCIGSLEMIIASFFLTQIINNPNLMLFCSGQTIAQISAILLLFGILGVMIYLIKSCIYFFLKYNKKDSLSFYLFYLYVFEFLLVTYLYRGIYVIANKADMQ